MTRPISQGLALYPVQASLGKHSSTTDGRTDGQTDRNNWPTTASHGEMSWPHCHDVYCRCI